KRRKHADRVWSSSSAGRADIRQRTGHQSANLINSRPVNAPACHAFRDRDGTTPHLVIQVLKHVPIHARYVFAVEPAPTTNISSRQLFQIRITTPTMIVEDEQLRRIHELITSPLNSI